MSEDTANSAAAPPTVSTIVGDPSRDRDVVGLIFSR